MENEVELMNETQAMEYVFGHYTPHPKKLIKVIKSLIPLVQPSVRRGFIANAMASKDPVKFFKTCWSHMNQLQTILANAVEDGFHGVIMEGETVYPVKINTRSNWLRENDKWSLEQEKEIQYELIDDYMKVNNTKTFFGKIYLFPRYGFSGETRAIRREPINTLSRLMAKS